MKTDIILSPNKFIQQQKIRKLIEIRDFLKQFRGEYEDKIVNLINKYLNSRQGKKSHRRILSH